MSADIGAVASPWTLDSNGYLLTASGVRAARIDTYGTMWLWDKRTRVEVPFTKDDWQTCQTRLGDATERHDGECTVSP